MAHLSTRNGTPHNRLLYINREGSAFNPTKTAKVNCKLLSQYHYFEYTVIYYGMKRLVDVNGMV